MFTSNLELSYRSCCFPEMQAGWETEAFSVEINSSKQNTFFLSELYFPTLERRELFCFGVQKLQMCRCGWQFGGTSVFFSSWKEKHKEFEREVIKNWWRDSNISPSSLPSVKKYLKNAKRFKNLISFPPVIPFLFTWSLCLSL